MNTLFHQVSWSTYLQITLLVLTIYYIFITVKYYRQDFYQLFNRISGRQAALDELPDALQYQSADEQVPVAQKLPANTTDQMLKEAQALAKELTSCITSVIDKPFAPAILIPKLKKILNDYPDIAATPDRELINELIVTECEKTGTALLSESEVDLWWSA